MARARKAKKASDLTDAQKRAARRAFAKGLTALPLEYVMCRDVRHKWDVSQDYHAVPFTWAGRPVEALRRVLTCDRCPATRTQHFVIGRTGLTKISDVPKRPQDYTISGIPRGVSVQNIVQQETYRRAMERATKVAPGTRATSA